MTSFFKKQKTFSGKFFYLFACIIMINFIQTKVYAGWQLDTTFGGGDGIFTHNNAAGGNGNERGQGIILQSDSKIIIAGYSFNSTNNDLAVWRLNSDGTLDNTFGGGDGIFTHNNAAGGNGFDWGYGVELQNDSRIIVVGYSSNGSNEDLAVWRLNTDGTLDNTFGGGDGIFIHNNAAGGNGSDQGYSISIQSDSKIVIAGCSHNGANLDLAVWRLNTDGTLDNTFGGGDGIFTHNSAAGGNSQDIGKAIALQNDSKIVVAGYSYNGLNNDLAVWRLNTDGTLDNTFGSANGIFIHNNAAGGNGYDIGNAISIQQDGKIIIVGCSNNGSNNDLAVWRLNTNGNLDTSFDNDGIFIHHNAAGGNGLDEGNGIEIQVNEKIVVVGYSYNGSNEDLSVWRLTNAQPKIYLSVRAETVEYPAGFINSNTSKLPPGSRISYYIYYDNDGDDSGNNFFISHYFKQEVTFDTVIVDTAGLHTGSNTTVYFSSDGNNWHSSFNQGIDNRIKWIFSKAVALDNGNDTIGQVTQNALGEADSGRVGFKVIVK